MAQQTPLYANSTRYAAPAWSIFHGWMMPLHYTAQLDEHHAVRTDAGMFDVSHMTIVDLHGEPHREFLRVSAGKRRRELTKTGKAHSTPVCLTHRVA